MKTYVVGCSVLSPIGHSWSEVTQNMLEGRCGIRKSDIQGLEEYPTHHAAYTQTENLDETKTRGDALFAEAFSRLKQSIDLTVFPAHRIGLFLGAEPPIADIAQNLKHWPSGGCESSSLSGYHSRKIVSQLALEAGVRGPVLLHLGTCSAANQAIAQGKRLVDEGLLDMAIVGGYSSRVDPLSMARLIRVGALAKTQGHCEKASVPFSRERNGFTMGEGAVLFAIVRGEHRSRFDKVYGSIVGAGASLDAHSITDPLPDGTGMALAIKRAIEDSGLCLDSIDYCNAHGTATPKNDVAETLALHKVFGSHAQNLSVSSTKSAHGHLMSAAGAIETLMTLIAIDRQVVPATLYLENIDPKCDLDNTPKEPKPRPVRNAINNSFGLGGQNACLVIGGAH